MSVEYFDRPVREPLDAVPAGKVSLPEAVPVPRVPARSMLQLIGAVVMLMLVAILIYVLIQIRQGWFSILPVMMLVMYGVMFSAIGVGIEVRIRSLRARWKPIARIGSTRPMLRARSW